MTGELAWGLRRPIVGQRSVEALADESRAGSPRAGLASHSRILVGPGGDGRAPGARARTPSRGSVRRSDAHVRNIASLDSGRRRLPRARSRGCASRFRKGRARATPGSLRGGQSARPARRSLRSHQGARRRAGVARWSRHRERAERAFYEHMLRGCAAWQAETMFARSASRTWATSRRSVRGRGQSLSSHCEDHARFGSALAPFYQVTRVRGARKYDRHGMDYSAGGRRWMETEMLGLGADGYPWSWPGVGDHLSIRVVSTWSLTTLRAASRRLANNP